jgi:uncharacterized membrane protein
MTADFYFFEDAWRKLHEGHATQHVRSQTKTKHSYVHTVFWLESATPYQQHIGP